MVKYITHTLDETFSALADPTRRAILARLAEGEASVTELAEPFDVSLPAVMKHLGVLEKAGLIERKKKGRVSRSRLVAEPLQDAAEWIAGYRRFWEKQFDALAQYLTEGEHNEGVAWKQKETAAKTRSASRESSQRSGKRSFAHGPNRKR
jgi:DNA-binding transcriptional ArsR family regulator